MTARDEPWDEERAFRSEELLWQDCRVYWGASGCDLERGHSGPHEQILPSCYTVTPETAFLFGEDLTEEERAEIARLWD